MTVELTEKQKERTRKNLVGVHPHLVQVVERAAELSPVPFVVTEGLRTLDRQKELKKAGKSWTVDSRHLTGHAVDLVDADNFGYEMPDMKAIATAMRAAGSELGIPIEWGANKKYGGDWKTVNDTPHFQLPKSSYPASGVGAGTKALEVAGKVVASRVVQTLTVGTGTAAALGAQEGAEKVAATPAPVIDPSAWATLPSPPASVTDTLGKAGEWKGAGQTAMSFFDFAQTNPYLFAAIAATVVICFVGPGIARKFGWEI